MGFCQTWWLKKEAEAGGSVKTKSLRPDWET